MKSGQVAQHISDKDGHERSVLQKSTWSHVLPRFQASSRGTSRCEDMCTLPAGGFCIASHLLLVSATALARRAAHTQLVHRLESPKAHSATWASFSVHGSLSAWPGAAARRQNVCSAERVRALQRRCLISQAPLWNHTVQASMHFTTRARARRNQGPQGVPSKQMSA